MTTEQNTDDSRLDWDIARRDMRERYLSREYWMIVFDPVGLGMVEEILHRHYADAGLDDVRCVLSRCADGFFGAVALPKRLMLANKLKWVLKKTGIELSEREIVSRDCVFAVQRGLIPAATSFGRFLFADLADVALPADAPIELIEMTSANDIAPSGEPNYRKRVRQLVRDGVIKVGEALNIDIAHDDWCAVYKSKPCDCDPDIINRETGEVLNRKENSREK